MSLDMQDGAHGDAQLHPHGHARAHSAHGTSAPDLLYGQGSLVMNHHADCPAAFASSGVSLTLGDSDWPQQSTSASLPTLDADNLGNHYHGSEIPHHPGGHGPFHLPPAFDSPEGQAMDPTASQPLHGQLQHQPCPCTYVEPGCSSPSLARFCVYAPRYCPRPSYPPMAASSGPLAAPSSSAGYSLVAPAAAFPYYSQQPSDRVDATLHYANIFDNDPLFTSVPPTPAPTRHQSATSPRFSAPASGAPTSPGGAAPANFSPGTSPTLENRPRPSRRTPSTSAPRGRRNGALPQQTKDDARSAREERSVCIWCKLHRVSCRPAVGADWCQTCEDRGDVSSCIPFYFLDLVKKGSTRFTEHHSISRRVLTDQAWQAITPSRILRHIDELGRSCVVRAAREGHHLYDIILAPCYVVLSEAIRRQPKFCSLERFIREQALGKDYISCVRPGEARLDDSLSLLAQFDDAPTPVTFSLVDGDGLAERSLDEDSLWLAHILSLIFGRQIEHAAFADLHKHLPNPKDIPAETMRYVVEQLYALRWRISLDGRRQTGPSLVGRPGDDSELLSRLEKDMRLCKKLYFFLCYVRQNPKWWHPGVDDATFGDRVHRYAGTRHAVSETLSQFDSPDAFADWMRRGQELTEEAGLQAQEPAKRASS